MATKITSIKKVDKITALNHNAGNINLASGAILSIGGLQYATDAIKTVALPTLTANTRYQVFAVISSGDVILVISTNENSVGPTGYTSWKLVGSFYSNGLSSVAFGSFISIRGSPKTGPIYFDPNINSQGLGTLTNLNSYYIRDGSKIIVGGFFNTGTRSAVEARIGNPFPVLSLGTSELVGTTGFGANTTVTYGVLAGVTGQLYVIPTYNSSGSNGMNTGVLGNNIYLDSTKVMLNYSPIIQGFSDTSIEDL